MARKWISGNTKTGHSVNKVVHKKYPWVSQVWFGGQIIRTDSFETQEAAIKYARQRARAYGVKARRK